jgi:thiopeptide-type bacteriocin biosynthesis protein
VTVPDGVPRRRRVRAQTVAGVRVPALPARRLAELYAGDDVAGALRALLAERGEAYHVLRLASPSLAHGVDKWLADEGGTGDHRRAIGAAFAYVARCAMRCTPLAACSTVSLTRFGDGANGLRLHEAIETRTRVDADWLYRTAQTYERGEALGALHLCAAGNAFVAGDRLEVLDAARSEMRAADEGTAVAAAPTSMNFTPAVRFALEAARQPVLGSVLAERIAEFAGAPRDAALKLIEKLVELGVLITELRTPLVADQAGLLAASVARVDAPAAERLRELARGMREVDDAPLARKPERLAALAPAAESFAAVKQFYQLDATRAVDGTLPDAFGTMLEDAFDALLRVTAPNRQARRLGELFARTYNEGREVPLLRLLETRRTFDFESELAALREAPVADGYHDELLELASGAIASGERVVALDDLVRRYGKTHEQARLAPSYEIVAHVLRADDGAVVPGAWNGYREGAGRSLSRFADLLGGEVPRLVREGVCERGGEAIVAELSLLPRVRRSLNVVARENPFAYELTDGVWPAADGEHALTLDDIVVGAHDGRLYTRSRRLDRLVSVQQSNLARQTANSRIAAFLSVVSQSDFPFVGFSWGAAAARLPFKPRVVLANAVVSPAAWRVPLDLARDFGGAAARAWRERWGVPRTVYLVHFDNRILLDLRHPIALEQIASFAAKQTAARVIELQEPLPNFSDAAVEGPHGMHVAEVAVSLHVDVPAPRGPARIAVSPRAAHKRAPGSEWTYGRCYLPFDRIGYFLESRVGALIAELGARFDDVHFVRYLDPDPHVRLRFRCASPEDSAALLRTFVGFGRRWVDDGSIDRFELGTYDREVERYGGEAAIDLAERAFTADSVLLLSLLSDVRTAADPFAVLVRDVAFAMLQLNGGLAETVAWAKEAFGRRPALDAKSWDAIKSARAALRAGDARYDALGDAVRTYLAAVPEPEHARAKTVLLHMHCNRAGASLSAESKLVHCAAAALEGELARQNARTPDLVRTS